MIWTVQTTIVPTDTAANGAWSNAGVPDSWAQEIVTVRRAMTAHVDPDAGVPTVVAFGAGAGGVRITGLAAGVRPGTKRLAVDAAVVVHTAETGWAVAANMAQVAIAAGGKLRSERFVVPSSAFPLNGGIGIHDVDWLACLADGDADGWLGASWEIGHVDADTADAAIDCAVRLAARPLLLRPTLQGDLALLMPAMRLDARDRIADVFVSTVDLDGWPTQPGPTASKLAELAIATRT